MKATSPEIELKSNFDLFDDFEIEYMALLEDIRGNRFWEPVYNEPFHHEKIIVKAWTLYGHYNHELCEGFGGVDAIADCPTKAIAEYIRDALKTYSYMKKTIMAQDSE